MGIRAMLTAPSELKSVNFQRDIAEKSLSMIGVIVVLIGVTETVKLLNAKACSILGDSESGILGTNLIDRFIVPKDRADFRAVLSRIIRGELTMQKGFDNYIETTSGEIKNICWNFSCIKDSDGRVAEILLAGEDITERRRIDRILAQKCDGLEASNKDLEKFAYVISHDLQEPLRTISSWAILLGKTFEKIVPEEGHEYLDNIVEGTHRMTELIEALLSYSRASRGLGQVMVSSFAQIVDEAIRNLESSISESAATIKVTSSLPILLVDQSQFVLVFQHILSNAIKFRSSTRSPEIKISAAKESEVWTFSISDNGIGIDRVNLLNVFEVFRRLHTREEYPGSGIGLSIVKKIAERHGGKIWIESQVGVGSTVKFSISESKVSGPDFIDRGR